MGRERGGSPFIVLWRTFVAQFFTNESVTSDVHLRQTIVWVLAFLVAPGVFLLVQLYPAFAAAVIRARVGRGPASSVDDLLEWVTFVLTTYGMVGTGFFTVLAWDSLTVDRRDAMVLGPLPLRRLTVLGAKLAALGTLLLAASIPINLLNSAVFAVETSDQLGGAVLVRHFTAIFAATLGASTFIFAAIVMTRSTVALLGGPRLASALGPLLQFFCIVALLCVVILSPAVWRTYFVTATRTNWLPSAWFVGVFEELRGSPRALDGQFPFLTLARRAVWGMSIAITGALITWLIECRRHMSLAVASASQGLLGAARLSRTLARLLVGHDAVARGTAEFMLLTLARNRTQQMPIAINAALGAAIVIAALGRNVRDIPSLMHPRTAVLWMPLVFSYWMTVGVHASFFVPSELPASWAFHANAPEEATAYWSATRACLVALVVPRALMIALLLVPLVGWQVGLWHALFVGAMTMLLVEIVTFTIHHIPFTRAYEPGHAKLRTRWPVYVFGIYAFAYWPAQLELRYMIGSPTTLVEVVACIGVAVVVLEVVGRRIARKCLVGRGQEDMGGLASTTVLGLNGA